jgi:hypothetical protein
MVRLFLLAALAISTGSAEAPRLQRGVFPSPIAPLRATGALESADGGIALSEFFADKIVGSWREQSLQRPMQMAAAEASIMRIAGDMLAQGLSISHGLSAGIRPEHTAAMGVVGFFFSGAGGYTWLHSLEGRFGAARSGSEVLRNCVLDYCCWAPVANCAYLFVVPALTGVPVAEAWLNTQHNFLPTMGVELAIFAPYNILAFSKIPLEVRPISSGIVSLLFTVAIAARC